MTLTKEDQPDDQAPTPDRSDQFREPFRKPLQSADEECRRPLQMGYKFALAQPVQNVEPEGTCERRTSKRRSMCTCSEIVRQTITHPWKQPYPLSSFQLSHPASAQHQWDSHWPTALPWSRYLGGIPQAMQSVPIGTPFCTVRTMRI
jgi:hypothetical protein